MLPKTDSDTLVLCLYGGIYPKYIINRATQLNDDNETIKSNFNPLYNMILSYWFPPDEGYDVCPHWCIPDARQTTDFIVSYVITHHQHPFLLVQIKPSSDFLFHSGRSLAMAEILQHLNKVGSKNQHADWLYAIFAIGKKWRACYTLKEMDSTGG